MQHAATESALLSGHVARLGEAYGAVGSRTWSNPDFLEANLEASRNLFTPESLDDRRPRPRDLDVLALLSGLPFPGAFTEGLIEAQRQISAILGDRLHYWVAPANLGLECCVFKWPTESLSDERLEIVRKVLGSIRHFSYRFSIRGIQINPDGCVVAKGFDEDADLFTIREQVKHEIAFLPAKQSAWAHVPLGRILEPLGPGRFAELRDLMHSMSDLALAATEIRSMKLVHETRWYMEAKTVLAEYRLVDRPPRTA